MTRFRNGYILAIPSGELLFCSLGTGEYNPLARECDPWQHLPSSSACTSPPTCVACLAVAVVLNTLVDVLKELTKGQALTDVLLFQNYAQTVLVIDELCKEGLVELVDTGSIIKAMALKVGQSVWITYRTAGKELRCHIISCMEATTENTQTKVKSNVALTCASLRSYLVCSCRVTGQKHKTKG
jgi:hypothetical protein